MQFIFDNLSAILISSAIVLILAGTQLRGQLSSAEAGAFYALKQQQLSFIELLEHDFNAAVDISSIGVEPGSGGFRLQTRPDPTSTAVREVVYAREYAEERDGVLYDRIVRYVDGIESGASAPIVTGWDVRLLNGEGKAVASARDGRQVYVRLELTYGMPSGESAVGASIWESTFYPPLLQERTTI